MTNAETVLKEENENGVCFDCGVDTEYGLSARGEVAGTVLDDAGWRATEMYEDGQLCLDCFRARLASKEAA